MPLKYFFTRVMVDILMSLKSEVNPSCSTSLSLSSCWRMQIWIYFQNLYAQGQSMPGWCPRPSPAAPLISPSCSSLLPYWRSSSPPRSDPPKGATWDGELSYISSKTFAEVMIFKIPGTPKIDWVDRTKFERWLDSLAKKPPIAILNNITLVRKK